MCKAFSCIVKQSGKVYWKLGKDGHEEIIKEFSLADLKEDNLTRVEIVPKDYLNMVKPITGVPEWTFIFDNHDLYFFGNVKFYFRRY
jgi:hypothetical protein